MSDKPTEPDWKAVAHMAMQQRDRAEQKANNMELDLAMAQQREAGLLARITELEAAHPAPTSSAANGSASKAAERPGAKPASATAG